MKVRELVGSLGASPDSLVCRPCRQDATRVVSFPSYTPRWEKKSCTCHISECSETFHSHMAISDEVVATIECANLVCNTGDNSTSIPLCKLHYSLIYQMIQQPRQTNCPTCGISLRHKKSRVCPQPEQIGHHLSKTIGFEGHITEGQKVCFSCYKSHLVILQQNSCTCESTDSDLEILINTLKHSLQSTKVIVSIEGVLSVAVTHTTVKVGEDLLKREVLLLPAVHEFFNQCVNSIAAASDKLDKTDLKDKTKVTSLWVLSELSANLKQHMACACRTRKYGTVMYRPDTDLISALQKALWKVRHLEQAHCETDSCLDQTTTETKSPKNVIFDELNA